MSFLLQPYPVLCALFTIANFTGLWYSSVSKEVPDPYLDEFFHIPQAQKYCIGDYSWDPKITTPPGLYLTSQLLQPLLGCSVASLRLLNSIFLCAIVPLAYGILRTQRACHRSVQGHHPNKIRSGQQTPEHGISRLIDAHSALNISLFPPLFFFSALYYTDILSTMLVLCTYGLSLKANSRSFHGARMTFTSIIGFAALWFRQTNIFWVAIFPAGLDVIQVLKAEARPAVVDENQAASKDWWNKGAIHDCALEDAGPQDYFFLLLSLLVATIRKPTLIMRMVTPYIALLALFTGFVVWNGSVVLGDKTAHTATVHIPQMLYIWPYISFFSLPLLLGPLLRATVQVLPTRLQEKRKVIFNTNSESALPTLLVSVILLIGSLIAIHFNTIIHPYTLADNRHYVFYVFRILRRHPAIKYLAAPVYCVCSWLVLQALVSPASGEKDENPKENNKPTNKETDGRVQISFVTLWLVTTALSVITAPLVEPRYFIIPWIIWRLRVPCTAASLSSKQAEGKTGYDRRLVLETIWLIAINVSVSYMFLYRTFSWPSEPGSKQRFIW